MKNRSLTDEQVEKIKELAKTDVKKVDIAKMFGVSPQLVSTVAKYGYGPRPKYRKQSIEEDNNWMVIAAKYSIMYPDDPIDRHQARRAHDRAIVKIRRAFGIKGVTIKNFI